MPSSLVSILAPRPPKPPFKEPRARRLSSRSRQSRRRYWPQAHAALALIALVCSLFCLPSVAFGADTSVLRIDSTTMQGRNHIVVTDEPTLTPEDVKVVGAPKALKDKTMYPIESGYNDEYIIDLSNEYLRPGSIAITANYRNVGYDPTTGETLGVVMTMNNFRMMPQEYNTLAYAMLGLPYASMPLHPAASIPAYPQVRLAANFTGGYWLLLACHATVDLNFYKNGNPEDHLDLSSAFITIQSLDADTQNIPNPLDGRIDGNEAVRPHPLYETIYLTPSSLVERWGDLTSYAGSNFPSITFPSRADQTDSFFYNRDDTTSQRPSNSDLAVTLYGVTQGQSFRFDVVDTQGWTHNMPYFGSIGSVEPPPPTKQVDANSPYALGDRGSWAIEQEGPGRDEMLGSYTAFALTDALPKECRATALHVYREDGTEVASGTKSGLGGQEVRYDFDLALESIYGHSYTLVIESVIDSYPEDGSLTLKNKGLSHLNGTFTQETNEVEVDLVPPVLQIEKTCNSETFEPGGLVAYTLTVQNTEPGTIAQDVVIRDEFAPYNGAPLTIVEGSLELINHANQRVFATDVTYLYDDAGNVRGFELHTHQNLGSQETLRLRYFVSFQTDNDGEVLENTAHTWANNAPEVQDSAVITPIEAPGPKEAPPGLTLEKSVDATRVTPGDEVHYLLTAQAKGDLQDLVITDTYPAGLHILEDSIRVWIGGNVSNAPVTFRSDSFSVACGDVADGTVVDIGYSAVVDSATPAGDLINHAQAEAKTLDPVYASARITVEVPSVPPSTTNNTPLARTGDPVGSWIETQGPAFFGGSALLTLLGALSFWLFRRRTQ